MNTRIPLFLLACILVSSILCGCSSLNVRHLSPRPWQSDQPETLTLKFWNIDYSCVREGNQFTITGTAMPRTERFPAWSTWMAEMLLTAYICTPEGNVIVRTTSKQEPGPFPPAHKGIPFTLSLSTGRQVSDPAITFGYKMIILAEAPGPDKGAVATTNPLKSNNAQIFFASQEALLQ